LSSIYFDAEGEGEFKKICSLLKKFYRNEKFVKIVEGEVLPNPLFLKGSNYCYISINYNNDLKQIVIFSAIDNLGKGASGNAVQNMNIMMGFEENQGLNAIPVYP
jgi:N-acetyl-gamma-glutamyl-phosphate reductase